jgi:hypothetical protein
MNTFSVNCGVITPTTSICFNGARGETVQLNELLQNEARKAHGDSLLRDSPDERANEEEKPARFLLGHHIRSFPWLFQTQLEMPPR